MDLLSRLFSFSGRKRRSSKSDENGTVQPRMKAESSAAEKYHESGTFCRESRVDQIESPYSSFLTVNSEHSNNVGEGTVAPTLLTRTLDRWNPETCVRLLRMPSVQNYSGLCKLISDSDKNWMVEFLDMGGLEVLFESVDRLSSKNSYSSRLERTLLLLQCVKCLKAVVNSHTALEYIIQQRKYIKNIAEVLSSKNPLVKKQLFDFMSTLCVFSEDGHYLTLDVFESYRVTFKLRYRFAVLIIEIKQAEVMPYVGAVLGLINCIILGACGFRFRTRIRNEFLALGLQDLLESLKQIPEEEVQLQCSVFVKSQLADEEYARSMGIRSSFSHFALFQALLDKIEDTPLSASFLILLQNLNQLDPSDSKTDFVWSILEELTERALSSAGSVLRNWMLNECRRSSLKSTSTQTPFFTLPSISIEDSVTCRKVCMFEEDYEKDSIKSFSSRDSGIPVSRNQSFASNGSRSCQSTLSKQKAFDMQFPEPVTSCSYAEFSNTIKDFSGSELSDAEKETFENGTKNDKDTSNSPNGFVKDIGLPLVFTNSQSSQEETDFKKETSETFSETSTLSFRSDVPIPQTDTLVDAVVKPKKTFSFSFFSRSKKYSLPKNSPKVNHPSPNIQHITEPASSASSRNGMTSIDLKRSRKHTQLSNNIFSSDNCSLCEDTSETTSSTFELYENDSDVQRTSVSRSYPATEECKAIHPETQQHNLSKSTSDLTQVIPPPPPPPPPLLSGSSDVVPRQKSQQPLGLPTNKNLRSSWSGNPTLKEFDRAEEKMYNTLPRPKSKMKTLNWAKIPSSHVSVHSIWSEIERESKTMEFNFEEMEKLFCQDEPMRKEPRIRQRKRGTSEISLLDSKRILSIGVFLKQFKGGLEEVIEYVRQCKHKEIGAEKLRTLINLLPDANEVKLLNSFSGDVNRLGTADKFIVRLSTVDHFECRVEGMLLFEEYPTTIQILHDSVQSLLDACQELLVNKGFKNFLKLILVTGNFMNSGSYAGNAVGFRLSTLPKLMETRANRPRITLLHYLVEETQRKDPDGIKFTNELLDKLNRCSRITLESLSTEISQLDKAMYRLNSRVKTENGQLKKHFLEFTENGLKHLTILKNKMEEIKSISLQLANRFCEDEKKFHLEECLNVVSVFCAKIKVADSENNSRKIAEEKRQISYESKIEPKFRNSKTSTL